MASSVQDVVAEVLSAQISTGLINMDGSYPLSRTNKIRQLREKASYQRETIYQVLEAGLVAYSICQALYMSVWPQIFSFVVWLFGV